MQLQSAFDRLLRATEPLSGLDALIWQSLATGSNSSKHPWNLGSLATLEHSRDALARPKCRTVVLRRADRHLLTIDCHTDVRSAKVRQLGSNINASSASWLFYDTTSKIQLRLEGVTEVIDGDEADAAWEQTSLQSRSSYLSIRPPGQRVEESLPPDTSDRLVASQDSERGRSNFRIVRTRVHFADWLYLRHGHHVRATIDYGADGRVEPCWVVP